MATTTPRKAPTEDFADAVAPHLPGLPYRALCYIKSSVHDVPLYQVAGVAGGPWKAEKALKVAFDLHNGDCFHCKKPIDAPDFSIDHAEPVALGGSSHLFNLLIAHRTCNQAKGHLPIEAVYPQAGEEWLSSLLQQVEERLRKLREATG